MGEPKQEFVPTSEQLSKSEEKHFRLRVKQLICGSLNGMRIRQSLPQPYIPQTGAQAPWRAQQLELEFRDSGAIPGQGLLLTAERQTEGIRGRRLWLEMPVEET